jgi:hypothetical protein
VFQSGHRREQTASETFVSGQLIAVNLPGRGPLPTRQMILDIICYVLADRRQLKHLVPDDRIVALLGKLPIHGRSVP